MIKTSNQTYNHFLLESLNNDSSLTLDNDYLKVNLYLTLLLINNNNYNNKMSLKEYDIIDNFLRKTNNLKVKIQLKRKEEEIDNLLSEINEIFNNNKNIITKYNINHLDVENILSMKDSTELTKLIDELTKEKIMKYSKKDINDKLRQTITDNIFACGYYILDGILYIKDNEKTNVLLDQFYLLFEYLLDEENYPVTIKNQFHKDLIISIIKVIVTNKKIGNELLIPVILTYLIDKDIPNYVDVDTSKFNVENIKITDLYSFAKENNNTNNTAKWKKVFIPNEYLYSKIKEIAQKGMYYFDNHKFVLENISRNISDFKLSITDADMKEFLKANLERIEI